MNKWDAYSKLYKKLKRDADRERRKTRKVRAIAKQASTVEDLVKSLSASNTRTQQKLVDIRRKLRRGDLNQVDFDFLEIARLSKNGRKIKDCVLAVQRQRAWTVKKPRYYRPTV